MTDTIVVTGATGTIGRQLIPRLAVTGARIRALVRDPATAHYGASVEVVAGDMSRPATLERAFAGATKAFVLVNGPDIAELEANTFAAAADAGVGHIVKLSALEAFQDHMFGTLHGDAHRRSEALLKDLGVAWTMLRPGFFASNMLDVFLRPATGGAAFYLPTGQGREAPIDPADIADAAAKVLTTPGHQGRVYELTGPQLLSVGAMARLLTAASGIAIVHIDVTDTEARARFLAEGFPPPFADFVLAHTAAVKADAMILTDGIPDLLRRPATTFADYAHAHAATVRHLIASRPA
jgi:uncharacterized protein YbjT (DUF2867 family)